MAHPFSKLEVSPMIALVWGNELSPVIATLIVGQSSLARRFSLAPKRVIHLLAAFVHHALEAQRETKLIGLYIEEQDVRALLACAVVSPHPRLYRMLDRLGPTAVGLSTYRKLNEILHGPAAYLLLKTDEVTNGHLSVLTRIVADPVLLAAHKAIGWSGSNLQNLQHALTYLRAKKLANDIENLGTGSGWKAIFRGISSDLGRARSPSGIRSSQWMAAG